MDSYYGFAASGRLTYSKYTMRGIFLLVVKPDEGLELEEVNPLVGILINPIL
jgi:hypothetical protein